MFFETHFLLQNLILCLIWFVSISLIIWISLIPSTCIFHIYILNKLVYWASPTLLSAPLWALQMVTKMGHLAILKFPQCREHGTNLSILVSIAWRLSLKSFFLRCHHALAYTCTWQIYERCIMMNQSCWVCLGSNYWNIHSPQVPVVKVKSIRTVSGWQLCHLTTVGDCAMSKCPRTHTQ